eukprot:2378859-Pyramimonas_sp.AAC.1
MRAGGDPKPASCYASRTARPRRDARRQTTFGYDAKKPACRPIRYRFGSGLGLARASGVETVPTSHEL